MLQKLEHLFLICSPFFSIHWAQQSASFFMWPEGKVFGWLWNGSHTASFTSLSANGRPLTGFLTGQTDRNQKGPSLDCGQSVGELPKSLAECCGRWVVPFHVPEHSMTNFLSFCANIRPQFITQYVTIIYTYYHDTSVHITFKDSHFEVPEHCQQKVISIGMQSGFSGRLVFPLHAPPFWFMMNPSFIPSDDAIQELITFMVAPLQKTIADVKTVALMSFRQIFGHPPCRTQECHALKNMLYRQRCRVVMWFLLLLHSLLMAWITALHSSCFSSVADVDSTYLLHWAESLLKS